MSKFLPNMEESDFKFLALKELIPNGYSYNGVDIILPEGSTDKIPTQKQIMDSVGGKSSSIQKYLEEGVDYATRTTKKEAGRLAGLKSGEVRAVPEGKDPSYVKRNKNLQEANKFARSQDKADFKKINQLLKAFPPVILQKSFFS